MEKDQDFNSCCGPGEWIVCNCLSECDDYPPFSQVSNNREPEEADNAKVRSDYAASYEGLSGLNAGAIALNELFLNFMAGGFTEEQALTLVSKIVLGKD